MSLINSIKSEICKPSPTTARSYSNRRRIRFHLLHERHLFFGDIRVPSDIIGKGWTEILCSIPKSGRTIERQMAMSLIDIGESEKKNVHIHMKVDLFVFNPTFFRSFSVLVYFVRGFVRCAVHISPRTGKETFMTECILLLRLPFCAFDMIFRPGFRWRFAFLIQIDSVVKDGYRSTSSPASTRSWCSRRSMSALVLRILGKLRWQREKEHDRRTISTPTFNGADQLSTSVKFQWSSSTRNSRWILSVGSLTDVLLRSPCTSSLGFYRRCHEVWSSSFENIYQRSKWKQRNSNDSNGHSSVTRNSTWPLAMCKCVTSM